MGTRGAGTRQRTTDGRRRTHVDDDEDGDEDVPLEDVPDLVDSSDDDAALETSMNVD